MTETERVARLLDDTFGVLAGRIAEKLHEAGLTVLPLEPDEATVEEMAQAMHDDYPHPMRQEPWDETDDTSKDYWRRKARAAYRAVVKGKA